MSYRLKTTTLWLAITFTACNTGTEPRDQDPPPPSAPAAPSSLAATPMSSSQVSLSWTDASNNEDSFIIERCSGPGCNAFGPFRTAPANSTGYTDLSVTAQTSYSYRVRASNNVGASSFSNIATAVTMPATAIPAPPTSPTATAMSSSRIDVTWTDASTNEDGFKVERCQGAGCTNFALVLTTLTPNGTSFNNTSLAASTTYRYRIQSYNGSGGSAFVGPVEATTAPAVTPNGVPSALVATVVSSSRINLTWTDNSTNEDAFYVERCQGAGCSTFAVIGSTPGAAWNDLSLTASTSYSYRVKAVNGAGSSAYSNIVSATTQNATPVIAAPSGLTVAALSNGGFLLTWTDNSNNEDGFHVERCQGAGCTNFAQVSSVTANGTALQTSALLPSTSYSFRVRAYNGAGSSQYSASASGTTRTAAPANFVATVVSSSRIDLSWTDNATGESGYTLDRCEGVPCTNYTPPVILGPNTTAHSSTGLMPSTSYTYRVWSVHPVSGQSSLATVTAVTPALTAPALGTPTVSGSSISLTWTFTWPGLASSADRYELEESTTSATAGFAAVHSPQTRTTPYTHTLTRGAGTYHYRVRAVTSEGTTPYSTVRSVTVTAQGSPIISVSVTSRTFNATAGGANPTSQQAQVGNAGTGSLTGLVLTEDPPASWLAVSLSSTTAPATITFQVTTGTLAAGTYTTAVRVSSPVAGNSPQTVSVTFNVAAAPAPPSTLRIINDLPGNVVGPNDWGRFNTVVRLRVGPTQNSVINMTAGAFELLFNGMSTSDVDETLDINPGQTANFNVSMMTGSYYLYIQNGWWDYFAPNDAFEKHLTGVVGCDGASTVYKATIIQITPPFGNPEEIRLSDWLPIGNYYGSPFCP
jgi:fibronectin type III domain protein